MSTATVPTDTELEQIGQQIKAYRYANDIRQETLADAAGVTQPYLSQVENGHKEPSLSVLFRVAYYLGVKPSTILYKAEL